MALINCPECGKQVSDSAKACIHCGYQLEKTKGRATFKIASSWNGNSVVPFKAFVMDERDQVLAEIRMGQNATFNVDKQMKVKVKLNGYFGRPEVVLNPNEHQKYCVKINLFGKIYLEKVDIIDSD